MMLSPRAGAAIADGLLVFLLAYRLVRLKRQIEQFKPDRTVHHRLDVNTILTRVS